MKQHHLQHIMQQRERSMELRNPQRRVEMSKIRKTVGLLLIASLSFVAGTASAQNLNLDEVGSLLALPIVTGQGDEVAQTLITVTNAGAAARLHVNVISGDPEDSWRAQDFSCPVTATETVLFTFTGVGAGSVLSYECSGVQVANAPLAARNGIFVVTIEDENAAQGTGTLNDNQIFGDAIILDFSNAAAYSVGAVAFQGVAPGPGTLDRDYRFDNVEYTAWPSAVATNFIAPSANGTSASLILFTLDGTAGVGSTPNAAASIKFYNDDEVQQSTSYFFDCFSIVDLLAIDTRFVDVALGSQAGWLVLTPEEVQPADANHDARFNGPGDSRRVRPIHGWIVQRAFDGQAAWGRTLNQSGLPLVNAPNDVPVLRAP
jgi:hypothetical protein